MGKKIAVLITDDFEDSEFTSPAEAYRKAGHEVITIEKEAEKPVKGKQGEASIRSISRLMRYRRTSLMPCCCRAATRQTPCAVTIALSPSLATS